MIEPEPSDLLAEQREQAYTYPAWVRMLRRFAPKSAEAYTLGMDASAWQTSINFQLAENAGMRFVFLRALYGLTVDGKFPQHWPGAEPVFPRGPYLYYRDDLDPVTQATKLYETCLQNGGLGTMPPVVDVESINNPVLTASRIRQCVERVNLLFGDVMLYTGFYVWRDAVTGDKAWASQYKLWLAGYPFTGWSHPQDLERVKLYPPLVPYPWTKFDVWQFTSRLPAAVYGVSGTYLDGNYCTEAFAAQYLNPTPPPDPDPEGDPLMRFVNIGNDISNIRFTPVVNTTNIIGKLPPGAVVTGTGMKLGNGYTWIEYDVDPAWLLPGKTGTKGWSALIASSGTILIDYLDTLPTPDPAPVAYRQTTTPANLRWSNAVNGQGYPIMSLPSVNVRPKFAQGAVVVVDPEKVNADGSVDYWTVLNGNQANPPTYPQPAGYEGRWFISDLETMLL